jgi:hypothetical protein
VSRRPPPGPCAGSTGLQAAQPGAQLAPRRRARPPPRPAPQPTPGPPHAAGLPAAVPARHGGGQQARAQAAPQVPAHPRVVPLQAAHGAAQQVRWRRWPPGPPAARRAAAVPACRRRRWPLQLQLKLLVQRRAEAGAARGADAPPPMRRSYLIGLLRQRWADRQAGRKEDRRPDILDRVLQATEVRCRQGSRACLGPAWGPRSSAGATSRAAPSRRQPRRRRCHTHALRRRPAPSGPPRWRSSCATRSRRSCWRATRPAPPSSPGAPAPRAALAPGRCWLPPLCWLPAAGLRRAVASQPQAREARALGSAAAAAACAAAPQVCVRAEPEQGDAGQGGAGGGQGARLAGEGEADEADAAAAALWVRRGWAAAAEAARAAGIGRPAAWHPRPALPAHPARSRPHTTSTHPPHRRCLARTGWASPAARAWTPWPTRWRWSRSRCGGTAWCRWSRASWRQTTSCAATRCPPASWSPATCRCGGCGCRVCWGLQLGAGCVKLGCRRSLGAALPPCCSRACRLPLVPPQGTHNMWRSPQEFRPERFLEGGEYDQFDEATKPYMFVPFIQVGAAGAGAAAAGAAAGAAADSCWMPCRLLRAHGCVLRKAG